VLGFAAAESLRRRTVGDVRQPPTAVEVYRHAQLEEPAETGPAAMPEPLPVSLP